MRTIKFLSIIILFCISSQRGYANEWLWFSYSNDNPSEIYINIDDSLNATKLTVFVGHIDISESLQYSEEKILASLPDNLTEGSYILKVYLTTDKGWRIQKSYQFNYDKPITLSSRNRLDIEVAQKLYDKDNVSEQDYNVNSQFTSQNSWYTENWSNNADASLLYTDNANPNTLYNNKLLLPNYQLRSYTQLSSSTVEAVVGNVDMYFSDIALQNINRRGAKVEWAGKKWRNGFFSINSTESLEFSGGTGISGNTDNSLLGLNSSYQINEQHSINFIAYSGGIETQKNNPFYQSAVQQEGRLAAINYQASLFDNRVNFIAEYDISQFDANLNDNQNAINDAAWYSKLDGVIDNITYGIKFERIGSNYQTIPNPALINDRKTYNAYTKYFGRQHELSLNLTRENNNISRDITKAELTSTSEVFDYRYKHSAVFNMGASIQHHRETSKNEPDVSAIVDSTTNAIRTNFNLNLTNWNLQLNLSNSILQDQADINRNSEIQNVSFYPLWRTANHYIYPGFVWINTDFELGEDQTQKLFSVNNSSSFQNNKIKFDGSFLWNQLITPSDSSETYSFELQIKYEIIPQKTNFAGIDLGILLQSRKPTAFSTNLNLDDNLIWLTLSMQALHSND